MFHEDYMKVCSSAKAKLSLLDTSPVGYFVAAVTAGFFIAFGGFVTFTVGAYLTAAGSPLTKVIMPFSFASALSLVMMAGAELFTGNNFVMAAGSLAGGIRWGDTARLWVVCYIGNLAGSLLAVLLFSVTGVPTGTTGEFFAQTAAAKMGGAAGQLFAKGILCNILVCLAVWCGVRMKSESGKLIMIFWCIYVFMSCGFEHSVANMSVMAVALLNPCGVEGISLAGYAYNLLWVTLGNMVGGVVFTACPYYLIQKTAGAESDRAEKK